MKKCFLILFISSISLLCTQASAETKRYEIPLEGSPAFGSQSAPVIMVEFIDYQ